MLKEALKQESNISSIYKLYKYKKDFRLSHPNYFDPIGTMIFSGSQGKGKTLSSVLYCRYILNCYHKAIFVSNVAVKDYPFNTKYRVDKDGIVNLYALDDKDYEFPYKKSSDGSYERENICIEYDGLDCLKYISNGFFGVLFLIDELHLELNSLESKNIDIDVMTEISQQRKQRKHIVGTSQVYMRLAKPLREQIFNIVLCDNIFGFIQYNKLIDGETSYEEGGKLHATVRKRVFWLHDPSYYELYDTYAKMKRYNKEWQGHRRDALPSTEVKLIEGKYFKNAH